MKRHICLLILLVLFSVFSSPLTSRADVFWDSLGRNVNVCHSPMRIISLAPNITEIIYFLGLDDRLVGVTRFSYFPREAQQKPKVGVYTSISVERVITLNPDLVIATADGNKRGDVEMLEEAGIPVYVINPRKVYQVLDTIERLGEVCGVTARAKRQVTCLRERVQRVVRSVENRPRPLVFLTINVKPFISVNKNTIHHDVIHLAGGRNMTGDQAITYPKLGMEAVIQRKPDVIIISSMERGGEYEKARKRWFQWSVLPAVQNGNVHLIDSDLIDRPAPRIVRGLEEMARLIHPEIQWHETR